MPHYAAWLIDLDGTLYRSLPVKVAMGIELCFAGRQVRRVIRAFRREHEALRLAESSSDTSPFEAQLARTAERYAANSGSNSRPVTSLVSEK